MGSPALDSQRVGKILLPARTHLEAVAVPGERFRVQVWEDLAAIPFPVAVLVNEGPEIIPGFVRQVGENKRAGCVRDLCGYRLRGRFVRRSIQFDHDLTGAVFGDRYAAQLAEVFRSQVLKKPGVGGIRGANAGAAQRNGEWRSIRKAIFGI